MSRLQSRWMSSWTRRSFTRGLRRALLRLILMNSIPGSRAICPVGSVYRSVHSDSCDPKTSTGSSARYFSFCLLSYLNHSCHTPNPTRFLSSSRHTYYEPDPTAAINSRFISSSHGPGRKRRRKKSLHFTFSLLFSSALHFLFVQK